MASKIGKKEWTVLKISAGVIDVIQWLVDLTGVGVGVNEVADPIIGVLLVAYFQRRGVSMIKHPKRLLAMVAGTVIEMGTADIAPAWIFDVWYIHSNVKKEEAEEESLREQEEFLKQNLEQPLYANGRRNPRPNSATMSVRPAVMNGVRAPGGGLTRSDRSRGNITSPNSKSFGNTMRDQETALSA